MYVCSCIISYLIFINFFLLFFFRSIYYWTYAPTDQFLPYYSFGTPGTHDAQDFRTHFNFYMYPNPNPISLAL